MQETQAPKHIHHPVSASLTDFADREGTLH